MTCTATRFPRAATSVTTGGQVSGLRRPTVGCLPTRSTVTPGACQVHRAELKRLHGSWLEAEDEARSACQELERFQLTDYLGSAHFEIGEIRRRMGDLASAEASFTKAYEQGHDAQPGLSLLMVDRGELEPAFKSISGALGRIPFDPDHPMKRGPSRARLLPAFIEIALLAGDREAAADAVAQLETIADGYESHVCRPRPERPRITSGLRRRQRRSDRDTRRRMADVEAG